MIKKRGGQAAAPLCVFSPGRLGFPTPARRFPVARGPPLTQGNRRITGQQQSWARRWGRASPAVGESQPDDIGRNSI
jgi:hypothetical protein